MLYISSENSNKKGLMSHNSHERTRWAFKKGGYDIYYTKDNDNNDLYFLVLPR